MSVQDITAFLPARRAQFRIAEKRVLAENECVTFRRPQCAQAGVASRGAYGSAAGRHRDRLCGMQTGQGTFFAARRDRQRQNGIYMHCISRCIAEGRQAILLVPEISLTPQTMGLFRARFGENVAVLHSRLSAANALMNGGASAGDGTGGGGARSAVFALLKTSG
jgi:primosomal protein N'